MSENKKFAIRLTEKRNGWSAEITRQVTSRRTVVSKREMGFESEELAQAWAEKELQGFIASQAERNARKSEARKEKEAKEHAKEALKAVKAAARQDSAEQEDEE
ncbi:MULTISPECIES: DUF3622 domain-containing protein [Vibrio]|uniref:DUF3622 domain-containing protein n=1 Tax=Vibrio qingdaonensis TaxID=2829491 RepID=A0A9X3HW01_9VIBR|nr:DUF3622 domain-containing protein [Vibrio qingdaonensis]MCW8346115.1 DUF3622 domain-containing protein [Vibrio qingdaonensis]